MPITAEHERPQPPTSAAFADAVTFAFADPAAEVFGLLRVGLSSEAGSAQASGLAVVFAGREPVAVRAAGGLPVTGDGFEAVDAAGVRTTVEQPLTAWTVTFASEDGTVALDLRFEAAGEGAELPPAGSAVAGAGGMQGYEHLCRVTGTARVRGGTRTIDGLGQRGHLWGAPDWDRITLARTVSAWAGDDLGLAVTAVRGAKAKSHADEAVAAVLFAPGGEDGEGPVQALPLAETLLSTTYDAEGRQRRAGLELYEDPEGYPHRAAGHVLCGTSLDLGRLRMECSFFLWRIDGREAIGRYDVLRHAEAA